MKNLHGDMHVYAFMFKIYMKARKNMHVFMYFLHLVPPFTPSHHNGKKSISENPEWGHVTVTWDRLPASRYAVRESTSRVKIFKNFKEKKSFKPEFGAEGLFGGHLLGVRGGSSLSFYDWESLELIRRIEIAVKHVSGVCPSP